MAVAGISTLGITFGYGTEATLNTKPTAFTKLTRINSIGELSLEPEQIDASALEDEISRFIAGRSQVSSSIPVGVNLTDATETEWETLISAYEALTGGKRMWFEVIVPGLTKAFFFVAQPPTKLPMPEQGQNSLMVMTVNLVTEEYIGLDTKVAFT